ncbi:Bacteriophage/Gene transfer agent portal protein [uncultured Caudovirales phage]|uniref:Bacteriophage/Gene transfer agent portal protein n=7 Tax=uncultured Caudovirales phage TaxID=2100421 RepID=A0A6J7X4I1_9CAUD|nr:Bacteriophage/Gene transfer agent portal protein [uncultured Caudovirales phage]CAB4149433.1 Bacteriophage/Gene transfer agent portal protein [uncultured Caudovirales phage]CAB4168335.1 Bacteriophage/Gene transfer agent portal protein [uncultured Caudovirales phage]CAB5225799.1 Bacteriophage/Gene transfer agent portal protein [uncultured Caudovirales phage]
MGIFNTTKVNKAAISPQPKVEAAAVGGSFYSSQVAGPNLIGDWWSYQAGLLRNRAMSVAAISRSRDLMASVLASMKMEMYTERWNETDGEMEELPLAPRSWLRQLDPEMPNSFLYPWIFDDLFFFGRCFLFITARTKDGYMASATRLPQGSITTPDQNGPVWFGKSKEIYFNGGAIDPKDVVQIYSPTQGMIFMSEQTIATALKLEDARYRNASSAIPAGVLKQTGGEPLSATELAALAEAFNQARATNQTAALNEFLSYTETSATPDKMLLIDAAEYQSKQIANLCNIPPYLLGISTGSYAYTNSAGAKSDLWTFGLSMYAKAITDALSQQLPRGTYVCWDTDDFLEMQEELNYAENTTNQPQENTQEELAS